MSGHETDIQWFIARDGKQHGPVSDLELKKLVELQHLKGTDLLWRQGFADWRTAVSVFPTISDPRQPQPAAPAASAPAPAASSPVQPEPQSPAPSQPQAAPAPATQLQPASHSALSQPAAAQPASSQPAPSQSVASLGGFMVTGAGPKPAADAWRTLGEAQNRTESRPENRSSPDIGATRPLGSPTVRTAGPFPAPGAATPRPESRAPAEMMVPQRHVYEAPGPSRKKKALVIALSLLAMTGIGAAIASRYGDDIFTYVQLDDSDTNEVPTVKADVLPVAEPSPPPAAAPKVAALDASLETAAPAPSGAVTSVEDIDRKLQARPMWTAVKQEFPDWYQQRVSEVARLSSEHKEQTEITRYLVGELVSLRRENARHALAASTPRHKELAAAFLANLKTLAQESGDGCYDFISKGESSVTIVARIDDPAKSAEIEAQMTAIVAAIAEGKKQPAEHASPIKTDYDVLAGELGRLGWTQADMQLFANPKELAKAPRSRVCTMLQDWFTAHLAIQDPSTQERLLFETLKPVISG